jgi:hypothetical protein
VFADHAFYTRGGSTHRRNVATAEPVTAHPQSIRVASSDGSASHLVTWAGEHVTLNADIHAKEFASLALTPSKFQGRFASVAVVDAPGWSCYFLSSFASAAFSSCAG